MSATHLPWLPPAPPDWRARCKALEARVRAGAQTSGDDEPLAVALRRLAGHDLGAVEQLKLQRLLALVPPGRVPELRSFRLGVVAARTLDFLLAALPACAIARGLRVDCVASSYDAIASFACAPSSNPFEGVAPDAVLVVLDEASFAGTSALLDATAETTRLSAAKDLLSALAEAVRAKAGCPAIFATIPACVTRLASADRSLCGSAVRFVDLVNAAILDGALARRWILWDLAALAADIGHAHWFDPIRHHQAKVPFAIELAPRVAANLTGVLAAMSGKTGRAIVLDLDNTLWGGEIGDDGVDGIRLGQNSVDGEAYVAFQRFVLDLRNRGIVIVVCSKNDDAIAREPFRMHTEMVLREQHIALFQANWLDKVDNIRAIAEALNLGLESLVFVDDNPVERDRVRRELPLVNVPEIGDDPAYFIRRIGDSGAFEHLPPLADDLARADAYRAEALRTEVRAHIGNHDEYLAALRMRLTVRPFDEAGRARIAQLVNKSNQFNLTHRRYNEEEIRRMAADPDLLCWQAALEDSFGMHGTIAVVIVRKRTEAWTIDTWLQSCRVLERGVEQALMNLLATQARNAGIARLYGEYLPTARNGVVRDFFPGLGFSPLEAQPSDGQVRYVLDPTAACAFRIPPIEVVEP